MEHSPRQVPKLTSHPSDSTSLSGALSSVLSNFEDYYSVKQATERRLEAYSPKPDEDDTVFAMCSPHPPISHAYPGN
jgi:hypothetical protein